MIASAEDFVRLRKSDDPELYRRAAEEPAPCEVWTDVLERYPDMAKWVAHNKTIPAVIIERLARSADADVRITVAAKRKCPPEVLQQLAADSEPTVRISVAYNVKTPRGILEQLLHDEWEQVVAVARKRLAST